MDKKFMRGLWGLFFVLGMCSNISATFTYLDSTATTSLGANTGFYYAGFPAGYQGSFLTVTGGSNVIRGTIIFKQGFKVSNGSNIMYDADGPIFDRVELGNSSSNLLLAADLRLGGTGRIVSTSPGTNLYATIKGLPSSTTTGAVGSFGNTIVLGGEFRVTDSLQFSGSCVIDGRGNTMVLTAPLVLDNTGTTTLSLKNMRVQINTNQTTGGRFPFNLTHRHNTLLLENVDLHLPASATTHFYNGFLNINRFVRILGSTGILKLNYQDMATARPCVTIAANSYLYVGPGVTLSCWGAGVPSATRIVMSSATSVLWLDWCTFAMDAGSIASTTGLGVQINGGSCYFDNKVTVSVIQGGSTATGLTKGLTFGDGFSSGNNVAVKVLGAANVIANGPIYYNCA